MLDHYANESDIPPCYGDPQNEDCIGCPFQKECETNERQ